LRQVISNGNVTVTDDLKVLSMTSNVRRNLAVVLFSNAAFSLASGLVMIGAREPLAFGMGVSEPWWLAAIGGALAVFSLVVSTIAVRLRPAEVLFVGLLDAGWVAVTLPFALLPGMTTPLGAIMIGIVAAIVALFATLQLRGVWRLVRVTDSPLEVFRYCVLFRVESAPEAVWAAIADLGEIARFVPELAHSELLHAAEPGPGAVRQCVHRSGRRWQERCVVYAPDRRELVLEFDTTPDDFPFPVASMTGGWRVSDAMHGATVTIWWDYVPKHRFVWILITLSSPLIDAKLRRVLGRMTAGASRSDTPLSSVFATLPC